MNIKQKISEVKADYVIERIVEMVCDIEVANHGKVIFNAAFEKALIRTIKLAMYEIETAH